ncbi:MAG: tetratricopeptide repeat protein, partial [Pseudomonadota bacterium]
MTLSASSLDAAQAAHEQGDLAGARAALEAVLASEQSAATQRVAEHNLALLLAQEGDIEAAIAALEAVLAADAVSSATFANLKSLRALQASQSLSTALGKPVVSATPEMQWLAAPAAPTVVNPVAPVTASADLERFVTAYAETMGERDTANYLSLYSLSYAPSDGRSRAAWQLDVLRRFAATDPSEFDGELLNINALNTNLAAVSFSLRDTQTDSVR